MNSRRLQRTASAVPTTSTAVKRDSLTAELERDPQFSTAKRQQRTQLFTNSISHASLERQLLAAQTARVDLETKLRERELQVERLERDRRHFADREREEREANEREQAENNAHKKRTDAEVKALRAELSSLRETHADLQDTHDSLARTSSQSISQHKSLLTTLQHRASLLEEELVEARTLADSRSQQLREAQDKVDELQAAQDESQQRVRDESDLGVVRDELRRQAKYLRQLERTNAKLNSELSILRDRQTSVEVLREKNRSLEIKLQHTDELRRQVLQLEAELDAARRERETWASDTTPTTDVSTSSPPTPSKTPISHTQNLTSLRLAHATLLETHGSTLASLRHLESTNATLTSQLAESAQAIDTLKDRIKLAKDDTRKVDVRARLAEREVGFLKALMASFDAEEAGMDNAQIDERKVKRISELESLLSSYKSTLASLSTTTTPPTPTSTPTPHAKPPQALLDELASLKSRLSDSEATNTELEKKVDRLEQELFELSGEVAGGRHVPPNTRVLQLADNPEQRWFDLRQAALDGLKAENAALLGRLRALESSIPNTSTASASASASPNATLVSPNGDGALVPRASYDLLSTENTTLNETIKQKEKRLLRLQQVFTSKSAEFREAIASILGVKLAFYPNGQVRVTSIFDLNASFVFQPQNHGRDQSGVGGDMKMQLVAQGEGGPQDVPSMMQYWIENEQCIPGFMASVTLECYDKAKTGAEG